MTKMNLEFLLAPSSNNGNGDRSSTSRASRVEGRMSLDRMAPRSSRDGDKYRSSKNNRHHTREGHHSRSNHPSSRGTTSTASKLTPTSKNQSQSTNRTKPRKPRNQDSPPRAESSVMENRPHVCRECQRGFYKLEQLKRHHRLVHLNLRPFKCTTCRLSFGTKQNMQVHLTTRKHQHKLETMQTDVQYSGREGGDRGENWAHYNRHAQHGSSSRHNR